MGLIPEGKSGLARRDFLTRLAGGVAAAVALPSGVAAQPVTQRFAGWRPRPVTSSAVEDESFWAMVKDQFPIRPGLLMMNAANLCPSPYTVSEAVSGLTRDMDSDCSFQNRAKFADLRESARTALATYCGADADEIAITRNTSESNNTAVNGLTLAKGDEVVLWDQNHPTNNVAWDVRAERFGFVVKRVKTPPNPRTAEELIAPFRDAITARTKALSITHVSSTSGVGLPTKELCQMARQRGIITIVDGAQTFGSFSLNLHDLGCDFYTGSAHKWFMGPKETGILYIRADRIAAHWPNMVGLGWERAKERGARKFETLGQRDDPAVTAIGNAVQFHNIIGKDRVEARVRALSAAVKTGLQRVVPNIKFHTPLAPELSGGIAIFTWPGLDPQPVYNDLYAKSNLACATTGGEFPGLRLSPHVYNTLADVDKAVEAVGKMAGKA